MNESEYSAYVAARRQRIKRWYNKRHQDPPQNDASPNGAHHRVAEEHDRVLEMLKLREDLAKDVSICDNANEVRAVYRWNPEHDGIDL